MMSIQNSLLGTLSYVTALMAGMFLASGRTPRRPNFLWRSLACFAALFGIRFGLSYALWSATFAIKNLYITSISAHHVFVAALCVCCVGICYQCNAWQALYCGIVGFCLQFLTRKVYEFTDIFLALSKPVETLFIMVLTGICYAVAWRKLFSHLDTEVMRRKRIIQVPIAIILIYINLFVRLDIFGGGSLFSSLMVWLLSVVGFAAVLMLEMSIFFFNNVRSERDMLLQLVEQQRKQYKIEQHSIEMINIKCHDMRHMLREKGSGVMEPALIREITKHMRIYDTHLNTGNEALTVILSKYGMECERLGIRMSCMLDGSALSFIPAYKMYAMFGNAIENAVNAVRALPEEKRIISISGQRHGDLLNIRVTNYYGHALTIDLENGLPVNHGENHGFGVKSIQMIAEEYGGGIHVQTTDELFILNILLPLPAEHQAA